MLNHMSISMNGDHISSLKSKYGRYCKKYDTRAVIQMQLTSSIKIMDAYTNTVLPQERINCVKQGIKTCVTIIY